MTTPNTDLAERIEASARKVMKRSALIADVDLPAHIAAAVMPIVDAAVKRGQAEALRNAANDPSLLLEGHSGIIGRVALLLRADLIEKETPR